MKLRPWHTVVFTFLVAGCGGSTGDSNEPTPTLSRGFYRGSADGTLPTILYGPAAGPFADLPTVALVRSDGTISSTAFIAKGSTGAYTLATDPATDPLAERPASFSVTGYSAVGTLRASYDGVLALNFAARGASFTANFTPARLPAFGSALLANPGTYEGEAFGVTEVTSPVGEGEPSAYGVVTATVAGGTVSGTLLLPERTLPFELTLGASGDVTGHFIETGFLLPVNSGRWSGGGNAISLDLQTAIVGGSRLILGLRKLPAP